MTTEEKAKAYDEVFERAKKLIETSVAYDRFTIEKIFPELKESEDERIRKELITHCRNTSSRCVTEEGAERIAKWIAWLEKQGGQKLAWSESDEKMFDYALDMIEWYSGKNEKRVRLVSDWLKSLRQRIRG